MVINALDLLYFRMYQPCSRDMFKKMLTIMPEDEKEILTCYLSVLQYQRNISMMSVDGIIGKNFSKELSFYLTRSEGFLAETDSKTAFKMTIDHIQMKKL